MRPGGSAATVSPLIVFTVLSSRSRTDMSNFKYPVPRMAAQIEREWSEELGAHLGCSAAEVQERPETVIRFRRETVRVDLMDGSSVQFKYAFFIASDTKKAIAVFSEHCGHHVFPHHDAKVFVDDKLAYEQSFRA